MNARTHPAAPVHEPTEAEIAHHAYLRWIGNGRPDGTELADWLAAKTWLEHHCARKPETTRLRPARGRKVKTASAFGIAP